MTTPISIELNPNIDRKATAEFYKTFGWVQIRNLLNPEAADALEKVLQTATPWELLVHQAHGQPPRHVTQAEFRALPPQQANAMIGEVIQRAGWEFAYIYMSYQMVKAYMDGRDPGHPLHRVTEFLNSPPYLDFVREITGYDDVVKVDAQASLYRPGDFLSLHDDADMPYRRAAYTLGMTRNWRADWGGQLLMHSPDSDIIRGLLPRFNTLTLFKVPTRHSVAQVANYAQLPRFSITGWLRNDSGAL